MVALQKIKKSPEALLAITVILLFFAVLVHEVFIFIAIAPLFALLDVKIDIKNVYGIVSGLFVMAAITFVMREISPATGTVFYAVIVMGVFVFYQVMQHQTQGRLNKLSLTILLIGVEYVLLKLSLGSWVTFLADAVQEKTQAADLHHPEFDRLPPAARKTDRARASGEVADRLRRFRASYVSLNDGQRPSSRARER